jgi:hypothetical protein
VPQGWSSAAASLIPHVRSPVASRVDGGLPGKVVVVLPLRVNIVPAIRERVKFRNPLFPPSTFHLPPSTFHLPPSTSHIRPQHKQPHTLRRGRVLCRWTLYEVQRTTTGLNSVIYDLSASGAWHHRSSWAGWLCCVLRIFISRGSENLFGHRSAARTIHPVVTFRWCIPGLGAMQVMGIPPSWIRHLSRRSYTWALHSFLPALKIVNKACQASSQIYAI